jgi:hypothetical protein
MCDHLHDTTSRYDVAEKLLTFIRVCRTCSIEQVVETLEYEPRPLWAPGGSLATMVERGLIGGTHA